MDEETSSVIRFNTMFHSFLTFFDLSSNTMPYLITGKVCLPEQYNGRNGIHEGTPCYVAGWGRTSEMGSAATVLQELMVPIISHKTCNSRKRGFAQNSYSSTYFLNTFLHYTNFSF